MINKSLWKNQAIISITFDMDWASEDALKYTCNILEEFEFLTSFFITHPSKVIQDKISKKEIHGGIHPNFLKNSTHGKNIDEVIDYCTKLLPQANSFRAHKYFDSNDICEKLQQKGFLYDSNLCTNLDLVDPFVHRSGLVRFPVYFEDGCYLLHKYSLNFKDFEKGLFKDPGLYILDFHPMHMIINSPTFAYMRKIKDAVPSTKWNNLTLKELEHLSYHGKGIRNFVIDLFKYIKKENLLVLNLEEVYESTTEII